MKEQETTLPAREALPHPDGAMPRCGGDEVERVYVDNAPLLRWIAVQRFGIAGEDADALVHDIFAAWLTNRTVVRGDIRAYLLGAMWNAARAFRRKRREEPLDESSPEPLSVPDEFVEQLSTHIAVGRTLARLNKRCVETLRRFYYEEESANTIAASTDSTPEAVRQMLRVCRQRARAICEELMRERNAPHS